MEDQGYINAEFGGETGLDAEVTVYNNAWDAIKDTAPDYDKFVAELSKAGADLATGTVQGVASNSVALRNFLQNIEIKTSVDDKGWKPFANNSDIENIGGAHGHVLQ